MEKLQLSEIAAAVGGTAPFEAEVNDICIRYQKARKQDVCFWHCVEPILTGISLCRKPFPMGRWQPLRIIQLRIFPVLLYRILERHCCKLLLTIEESFLRF